MFAAIYHPVGIAMLVAAPKNMGSALGWNGLWGNLGLAVAAIVSGALMDLWGWRAAFFVPGLVVDCRRRRVSCCWCRIRGRCRRSRRRIGLHVDARTMARIFAILLIATACGGVIFNSTTVAMPKVFDERLRALTQTSLGIGALVALVYIDRGVRAGADGRADRPLRAAPPDDRRRADADPAARARRQPRGLGDARRGARMMLAVFGQIPLNDAIVGKYVADEYRARALSVRYVVSLGVAAVAVPMIARAAPHRGRLQQRVPGARRCSRAADAGSRRFSSRRGARR